MVSSNEMDLFWVHTFQGQQETDSFDGVTSSVDKISKKHIIIMFDVFSFPILVGSAIETEESHEICELSMDIAKDFERGLYIEDHGLPGNDILS